MNKQVPTLTLVTESEVLQEVQCFDCANVYENVQIYRLHLQSSEMDIFLCASCIEKLQSILSMWKKS